MAEERLLLQERPKRLVNVRHPLRENILKKFFNSHILN